MYEYRDTAATICSICNIFVPAKADKKRQIIQRQSQND